jgi:hypothetical protein
VRRWLRSIDIYDFYDWLAFFQLEPFGPTRDNYHAAIVATAIMDAHGARKAPSKQRFEYEDFIVKMRDRTASTGKQTWQTKLAFANIIARAVNANTTKAVDIE